MRTSRRAIFHRTAVALVAAFATLTSVLVAPAQAGPVFSIRFQGQAAFAVWSTCPVPEVGDLCEETVVMAFDARTQETTDQPSGPHFLRDRSDVVVLQRFWSEVQLIDGELFLVPTKESFGRSTSPTVRIPQRVTSGSARAQAISMHTFDYVTGTEATETDSVAVTWQATGSLQRIREGYRASQRIAMWVESTKGWSRAATATGTVDGQPIAGVLLSAELVSVTQRTLTVLRGHNAPQ